MEVERRSHYGWLMALSLALAVATVYCFARGKAFLNSDLVSVAIILGIASGMTALVAVIRLNPADRPKRVWEPIILIPLFGFLAYAISAPKLLEGAPRHIQCLSNIKQLSTALMMYCSENDGHLPPGKTWRTQTFGYLKRKVDLKCPWAESEFSYGMNKDIPEESQANLTEPETLVMVFEGSSDIPNFVGGPRDFVVRHQEMGSIGFADGHAKFLKRADPRMRWKP